MKKILIAIFCLCCTQFAKAQEDSIPIYKRFPSVPMFSIINVADSTVFSRNELKKKKPVIIILFNPDCSHCIHFTKELLASYDLFKETQFVMISSLDHHLIKKFYEENKISNYPNIHMGRDGNFFLGTFYKPKNYPAIYIYDKKRNFVKSFDGDATIPKIAEALRN